MKKLPVLIAGFLAALMALGYFLDRTSTPELKRDTPPVVVSSTIPVSSPVIPHVKPQPSPKELALSKFMWEGHQLPSTLLELTSKQGKPLNIQVLDPVAEAKTPEDKKWAAETYADVYKTAEYPGFEATYYGGGRLDRVTISSGTCPVLWGLGIGVSTEAVVKRLGIPTDGNSEMLHYIVWEDGDQTGEITFKFINGKAANISWQRFTE